MKYLLLLSLIVLSFPLQAQKLKPSYEPETDPQEIIDRQQFQLLINNKVAQQQISLAGVGAAQVLQKTVYNKLARPQVKYTYGTEYGRYLVEQVDTFYQKNGLDYHLVYYFQYYRFPKKEGYYDTYVSKNHQLIEQYSAANLNAKANLIASYNYNSKGYIEQIKQQAAGKGAKASSFNSFYIYKDSILPAMVIEIKDQGDTTSISSCQYNADNKLQNMVIKTRQLQLPDPMILKGKQAAELYIQSEQNKRYTYSESDKISKVDVQEKPAKNNYSEYYEYDSDDRLNSYTYSMAGQGNQYKDIVSRYQYDKKGLLSSIEESIYIRGKKPGENAEKKIQKGETLKYQISYEFY